MKVNPSLLIAEVNWLPFLGRMEILAARIRQRLDEIGMSQADLARLMGMSMPRIGNYYHGRRPPDIATLARLARALQTSADWLIGLSEARQAEAKPVFLRLLQLDGMPEAKAEVLAEAASTALRLLSTFPDEGDERTRAHLAAQAAWQIKPSPKPH
jgi:transcriptional regulator with XRE-family HTH domain